MRSLSQVSSAPSQSPAPSPSSSNALGPTWGSGFDVQGTVIYVGVSIGILVVGLLLVSMLVFLWIKPRQRQVQVQRQRNNGVQDVKAEGDAFVPQIRPFPVICVHPNGEGAFASSDNWFVNDMDGEKVAALMTTDMTTLSGNSDNPSELAATSDMTRLSTLPTGLPRRPSQQSVTSSFFTPRGSAASADLTEGSVSFQPGSSPTVRAEDIMVYNPLTHFVTERQPQLFVADFDQ